MKKGEKGDLVLCIDRVERIGRAGSEYYVPEIIDVGEVQEDFDHTSSSMYILVLVKMRSTGEVRNIDNTNLQLVLSPDDWPYCLSKEENLIRNKPCKGESEKNFKEKNGLLCTKCDSVICSWYRHDFCECKCGAIFIDGGDDYFRCGGKGIEKGEYKEVEVQIFEKKAK